MPETPDTTPLNLLFHPLPVPEGLTPWKKLCLFTDGGDGWQTGYLDPSTRQPKAGVPGYVVTIKAKSFAELPHFGVITSIPQPETA